MTAVHCDNDRCKHNEDRLCTRADMYCVGRRCRSERHMTYIDLMRGRDPCPHKNAIRSAQRQQKKKLRPRAEARSGAGGADDENRITEKVTA